MFPRILILCLLVVSQLGLLSCQDESEDQIPEDTGGTVPAGMTRLYGNVRDQNNQPVPDVAVHVIYAVGSTPSVQEEALPSQTLLYYVGPPLTTQCDNSTAIPDGVVIKLFWDADSDSAELTDPQPPLCADPPQCESGPIQTVNFTEFLMNGASYGSPGTFTADMYLVTTGEILSPNRFFVRIFCEDGSVLWTSNVIEPPGGYSEYNLSFTCTQCDGIPVIPQWALDQSYPNPAADSVTIPFGLETSATALLTLRDLATGDLDTLLHETRGAGSYYERFAIGNRPNGLYEYRLSAESFQDNGQLLKEETNVGILSSTEPRDWSDGAGTYRFDTAAGSVVSVRDEENENLGSAVLDHVRIIALKPGYITADTSVSIVEAESLRVDLNLLPE